MQGYTTKQILTPFFEMPNDKAELQKVYRTLAKSADMRLKRLEDLSKQDDFKSVTKWAYARAMNDIKQWSGAEAKRFNTAPPDHKLQLIAKINDIKTFLEAPTSTKSSIVNMFQSRADTINDKYGTNLNWTDMGEFFESEMFEKLSSKYDSDTVMQVLGTMNSEKDKVVKSLKYLADDKKKQVRYVSDDAIQKTIEKEIMRDYPDEVRKMLGV